MEGEFYVEKSPVVNQSKPWATEMDEVLNPAMLMRVAPSYYGPRFEAIADLRNMDDGTLHRGNEFRRIASFVNVPLFKAAQTLLDPEFMSDRKRFYAFLRRNREYCTYDIRSHTVAPRYVSTVVDGRVV